MGGGEFVNRRSLVEPLVGEAMLDTSYQKTILYISR